MGKLDWTGNLSNEQVYRELVKKLYTTTDWEVNYSFLDLNKLRKEENFEWLRDLYCTTISEILEGVSNPIPEPGNDLNPLKSQFETCENLIKDLCEEFSVEYINIPLQNVLYDLNDRTTVRLILQEIISKKFNIEEEKYEHYMSLVGDILGFNLDAENPDEFIKKLLRFLINLWWFVLETKETQD